MPPRATAAPRDAAIACLHEALASLAADGVTELRRDGPDPLEEARHRARACQACPLSRGRATVVFGEGNALASIALVGEGPGADEDRLGRPFVGRAGALLDELLAEAGLPRAAIYITNVVKCRPPRNRDPASEEVEACAPWLREQLHLIRPRVLVSLGKIATQALTGQAGSIGRLRGQRLQHEERAVIPTYHPAYLLRNPEAAVDVISDLRQARELARA
jgi:uracil-DNA glycosylase